MKNKRNIILFITMILTIFISIFILNRYSIFTSDDYSFLYEYYDANCYKDSPRITNITQIFGSMKNLYLNVNGRIVPHFILQFLLMFPKIVFDIVNSIAFIVLGLVIYKTIYKKETTIKEIKIHILLLIYSLMYLCIPSFGMSVLWCCGSLNYMWPTIFILSYFNYLIKLLNTKNIKLKQYILLFVLAFISSNAVENFALAVLFFTFVEIIINVIKNKKVRLWYIIPIIASGLGNLLLFTAASGDRISVVDNLLNNTNFYVKTVRILRNFNWWIYIYLFINIIAITLAFTNSKKDKNIIVYCITGIFSIIPLYASTYIEERMFFLAFIIMIILILYILNNLLKRETIKIIISIILFITTIYVYIAVCYKDVKKSYDEFTKIENIIIESKTHNKLNVVVPNYRKEYSKYSVFNNEYTFMINNSEGWMNRCIAYYYGVETIRTTK